jgi:hypothetical protein
MSSHQMRVRFYLPYAHFGPRRPWYICAPSRAISQIRHEVSGPIDSGRAVQLLKPHRVLQGGSGSMRDHQQT